MNRKIKNTIMISIIIIVVVLSFFTINDVKNSMSNNMLGRGEMGQRGEIPSEENMPTDGEMPEMPEGGFNNSSQTPPEKPDGTDNTNNRQNSKMERPSDSGQRDIVNIPNNKITTSYYILFTMEALIVSILLVYLVMSNFNQKTVLETLGDIKKILIYVVIVIVLTAGLTFLQSYLTKNIFINNEVTQIQTNTERFNQNIASEEVNNI